MGWISSNSEFYQPADPPCLLFTLGVGFVLKFQAISWSSELHHKLHGVSWIKLAVKFNLLPSLITIKIFFPLILFFPHMRVIHYMDLEVFILDHSLFLSALIMSGFCVSGHTFRYNAGPPEADNVRVRNSLQGMWLFSLSFFLLTVSSPQLLKQAFLFPFLFPV